MSKIVDFLRHPLSIFLICGICLLAAFIDSFAQNASSVADLSITGKIFTGVFVITFGVLFVRYFILPIGKWLISLVD